VSVSGASPVRQFLNELKATDPGGFAGVLAGLAKLQNSQHHHEPLCKSLGDGLFEMRHVGKLNTRVLWFFVQDRRIVAVHGIRNKGRAISRADLKIARERMYDWQKRELH
jgi:phage-related protein